MKIKLKSNLILVIMIFFLSGEYKNQSFPESGYITSIYFMDFENGLVSGKYNDLQLQEDIGVIYKTVNGGELWTKKYFGHDIYRFTKFKLFENGIGYVGAETGANEGSILLKTTDNGENWDTTLIISDIYERVSSISFIDDQNGYFCTYNHLYKTIDGGLNWQLLSLGNQGFWWIESISFLTLDSGFICAELTDISTYNTNHLVLKTIDGGMNWEVVFNDTLGDARLLSIKFLNNQLGVVVGGGVYGNHLGFALRTMDGGTNWIFQHLKPSWSNLEETLLTVEITNDSVLIVGGQNGALFRSTDYGVNWATWIEFNNFSNIYDIYFLDDSTGWATYGADLIRTTNSGEQWYIYPVIASIDDDHNIIENILLQNYPNPFNPSTKISWQSPVSSWQTLKVFDVLGNEVAILVNEYRAAGSYEIEFNPSSINHQPSSGVYFYQLKVGDYVETRKMILMK